MELERVIRLTQRWWWLLVLGTAAGLGAALGVGKLQTPIYSATTTLLVNQSQTPGSVQYNDILTSERLTTTYRELISKRPVLESAAARLDGAVSADQLAGAVSVSVIRDTQLLRLSARNADRELAKNTANAVAEAFISQNAANQISRPGSVSIVEAAETPGSPVSPNLRLLGLLGVIAGFVVAAGAMLLFEYLDDTLKTSADVERVAGMITLAGISRFRHPAADSGRILAGAESNSRSAAAEAYKVLRTNVEFAAVDQPARTLLVTSASPQEGKTTTAVNLALAIAQAGKRVILVDADLRRPTLHRVFELGNAAGLTTALVSPLNDAADCLQPSGFANLMVITSGPPPPNPSELLSSPRVDRLLAALRERADVVVLDSAPALAVTDSTILAAKVDGTILVVQAGKTRSGAVAKAGETLARAQARVLGVVMNSVRHRRHADYYGGYHHYYTVPSSNGHNKKRSLLRRTKKAA